MTDRYDVDVLVVGSGAAGLAAAVAAREAGAGEVLIAEAEGVVGGASRLSGGIMMGVGTRLQQANGIEDSPEAVLHEYLAMNRWEVDAGLARRFVEHCGPTLDWLADLGVPFEPWVIPAGQEAVPHGHMVKGTGAGLVEALHAAARERDVDVALGRRVDRLLVEDGAVTGAAVGGDEVRAPVTVLASGGFCASPEKIATWWPDGLAGGDWAYYIAGDGAPGSQGDALDLGTAVGAEIVGRNRGLRLLHTGFHRDFDAASPGWVVLVDGGGRRFVAETSHYGVLDWVVKGRGDRAFALFDDRLLRTAGIPASKWDPEGAHRVSLRPDLVDPMVSAGRAHAAGTVRELATAAGLDPDVLEGTVAAYNAAVDDGVDHIHGKPAAYLQPLRTPPFYAVEMRPASLAVTACGLRIDPDARVVGERGEVVPGLLAAGECTGGVIGPFYAGSGNSLSNCVTFGRIAGRTAAASVSNRLEGSVQRAT